MAMDSLTLWHVSTVLLGRSFTRTNQTGLFPLVPNKGSTWLGVPPSWERSSCLTNKVKMEFVFQLSSLMGHGKPPYIAHCHLDEPNLKANSISFYITCKYIYIYLCVCTLYLYSIQTKIYQKPGWIWLYFTSRSSDWQLWAYVQPPVVRVVHFPSDTVWRHEKIHIWDMMDPWESCVTPEFPLRQSKSFITSFKKNIKPTRKHHDNPHSLQVFLEGRMPENTL